MTGRTGQALAIRGMVERSALRGLDPSAALELPEKPSVAVHGFSDLGGHEDGRVLAEGLAADLSLALGHMRSLFATERAAAPDAGLLSAALGDIARARGMTDIAKAAGITREALYRALRPGSAPRFDTVNCVCTAHGVRLVVQPLHPA